MISPDEGRTILRRAYVPEHIVGLMARVSGGEPFLAEEYLGFARDNWVILVGYPLTGGFDHEAFGRVIAGTITSFRPEYLWFIAPEVPASALHLCGERESDDYYTLALQTFTLKPQLRRMVNRTARELTVERGREIVKEHEEIIAEFLEREKPAPRVATLFRSMAGYVAASDTAVVLTSRDRAGTASAFYVVELAAEQFATYVVGCHSKRHYAGGASDLLFAEMIGLAAAHGKSYIHLGLGVNAGIRRFKEKWGGVPRLRYQFCEYRRRGPRGPLSVVMRLWA